MTEDRWAGMVPLQAQSEILAEMARNMTNAITGDWNHATYHIVRLGGQGSGSFEIVDNTETPRLGDDRESFRLSKSLRRVMSAPGKGAWFSMVLRVDKNGSADAEFDYDSMPQFSSKMMGVSGYRVAMEQHEFPRDAQHQPRWYADLLDEYLAEVDAKQEVARARDQGWGQVGQTGPEVGSHRLVVLGSGVGLVATAGYSDPSAQHLGDPGFELYMPSSAFVGDLDQAQRAWPFKGLNHLVMVTTDDDVDWPARVAQGPVHVMYVPNLANNTPTDWRDQTGEEDLCGILVGVPFAGVPATLDGPHGPLRLVGVLPARPAEWAYLAAGGPDAPRDLAARLAGLDPLVLASPDRPSVVS